MSTTTENGPLHGIRVIELGNFIAAPFASRLFADFGAEVIKIERPASETNSAAGVEAAETPP